MKRILWILSLILIAVVAAYNLNIETTTAPEWSVQVLDPTGNPVPGVAVVEHWQDYSIEPRGHEATSITDQKGVALFPRRTIRANLLRRTAGAVREFLGAFIDTSFGSHADVTCSHEGLTAALICEHGEQPESVMQLK